MQIVYGGARRNNAAYVNTPRGAALAMATFRKASCARFPETVAAPDNNRSYKKLIVGAEQREMLTSKRYHKAVQQAQTGGYGDMSMSRNDAVPERKVETDVAKRQSHRVAAEYYQRKAANHLLMMREMEESMPKADMMGPMKDKATNVLEKKAEEDYYEGMVPHVPKDYAAEIQKKEEKERREKKLKEKAEFEHESGKDSPASGAPTHLDFSTPTDPSETTATSRKQKNQRKLPGFDPPEGEGHGKRDFPQHEKSDGIKYGTGRHHVRYNASQLFGKNDSGAAVEPSKGGGGGTEYAGGGVYKSDGDFSTMMKTITDEAKTDAGAKRSDDPYKGHSARGHFGERHHAAPKSVIHGQVPASSRSDANKGSVNRSGMGAEEGKAPASKHYHKKAGGALPPASAMDIVEEGPPAPGGKHLHKQVKGGSGKDGHGKRDFGDHTINAAGNAIFEDVPMTEEEKKAAEKKKKPADSFAKHLGGKALDAGKGEAKSAAKKHVGGAVKDVVKDVGEATLGFGGKELAGHALYKAVKGGGEEGAGEGVVEGAGEVAAEVGATEIAEGAALIAIDEAGVAVALGTLGTAAAPALAAGAIAYLTYKEYKKYQAAKEKGKSHHEALVAATGREGRGIDQGAYLPKSYPGRQDDDSLEFMTSGVDKDGRMASFWRSRQKKDGALMKKGYVYYKFDHNSNTWERRPGASPRPQEMSKFDHSKFDPRGRKGAPNSKEKHLNKMRGHHHKMVAKKPPAAKK